MTAPRQDSQGPTASPQQILLLSGMTQKREKLEAELRDIERKQRRDDRWLRRAHWLGAAAALLGMAASIFEPPNMLARIYWPLLCAVLFALNALRVRRGA